MTEASTESALLTEADARKQTRQREVAAVAAAMAEPGATPESVIAAYRAVEMVLPDDCEDVDPKFGQCEQEHGHDGPHYTTKYDDPRRPDGTHVWDY